MTAPLPSQQSKELLNLIPRSMDSYTLENFATFCGFLVLGNGPMRLEDFQRVMLAEHFDGTVETIVIIPKKNGKTTLMAGLCLFRIWCQPDAKCFIAASARDQARNCFDWAAKMVKESELEDTYKIQGGYIRILSRGHDGFIRVVPSDPNTLDGIEPDLAIVDELHRHPNGDVYAVIANGLLTGQMITISTAGATIASPLGKLRIKAHQWPNFTRNGCYNRSSDEDSGTVMHEWCLDETDDVDDIDRVKMANPAPFQTKANLKRRHSAQKDKPWEWLRFACGIWTEGEEPWIKTQVWDSLPLAEDIPEGEQVSLGIRVGQGHQTAALVWLHTVDSVHHIGYELLSAESGLLLQVEQHIRDLNERFNVGLTAYVSKTFDRSAETLAEEGLVLIPYPVGSRTMDMAETLLKVIGEKRLAQPGLGPFRNQVLAGQAKVIESGWKWVDRPGQVQPVDALFALAAAVHVAETQHPKEFMFDWS